MHYYFGLLLFIVNFMACSTVSTTQLNQYDLAIKNVKIFDSKNKEIIPNKTILIKGDQIAEIIDATETFQADKIIEGDDKLVTPGFIDTHVHLQGAFKYTREYIPEYLDENLRPTYQNILAQQYLAFGTTTIIDMGQKDKWVDETIQWQKNPAPEFPNLFINGSSMISDERRRPAPHHLEIMDEMAAKNKVREYAKKGLQYMKLYSRLRAPEMEAIIAEGKKHNITFNAHVDNNVVTIPQAMDLGVRNFEHFFTLSPSILAYNEHWVLMDEKYQLKGIKGIDDFSASMAFFFGYIKAEPAYTAKLHRLFDRMNRENATLSTAIHVLGSAAGKTSFFSSFNYFPIRNEPSLNQYNPLQRTQLGAAFEAMMEFAKTAHDKGVKLRIGTDCNHGGRALLSELMLFAKAKFPVEDILQIATWNGYKAMKLDKEYGTIEKGKKADLIIFEQNPFDDYAHFLADKTVIKGGKAFVPKPSIAFTLLDKLMNQGLKESMAWFEQERTRTNFALDTHEMKMIAFHLATSNKLDAAVAVLKRNQALFPDIPNMLEESLLNEIGYGYLREKKVKTAITIFEWNVQEFPTSWNVYDSLGEAYRANGNTAMAIKNYEKSMELNPENEYGIKALKELKRG